MLFKFLSRLKAQLIAPVPEALAVCEFECRVSECSAATVQSCPRRTRGVA